MTEEKLKLKLAELYGIQSHERTVAEFAAGVNVFMGESGAGKSAILKSIGWTAFNRPLRVDALKRDGAKEQVVELTNGAGQVRRRKTKTLNEYYVNDAKFSQVSTDVPEPVRQLLGLEQLNFLNQLDPLFFLSASPGERARFLNDNISDLWLIDSVVNAFHNEIRTASNAEQVVAQRAEELEHSAANLDWVDAYKAQVQKLQGRYGDLQERKRSRERAEKALRAIESVGRIPDREKIKNLRRRATALRKRQQALVQNRRRCGELLKTVEQAENLIASLKRVPRATAERQQRISELKQHATALQDRDIRRAGILTTVEKIEELEEDVKAARTGVDEARDTFWCEFPDVCPLCGSKINKETDQC